MDNAVKFMFKFDVENWFDVESEEYYIGWEIMLNMRMGNYMLINIIWSWKNCDWCEEKMVFCTEYLSMRFSGKCGGIEGCYCEVVVIKKYNCKDSRNYIKMVGDDWDEWMNIDEE